MTNWKVTTIGLGFLVAASSGAHAANVTNGSFEQTIGVTTKTGFSGHVTGWGGGSNLTFIDTPGTADNGNYLSVYKGFPATSPVGGNFVEADGDPGYSSAIFQTLTGLTVGASYVVNFYQAAGQQLGFTGPTTEQWAVSLGGTTKKSALFSLPQGGTGPWQKQALTFVADASSDVLSFLAVGTPGGAPPISFLDGVDVTPVAPGVPAPGMLGALGLAMVGIVVARKAFSRG